MLKSSPFFSKEQVRIGSAHDSRQMEYLPRLWHGADGKRMRHLRPVGLPLETVGHLQHHHLLSFLVQVNYDFPSLSSNQTNELPKCLFRGIMALDGSNLCSKSNLYSKRSFNEDKTLLVKDLLKGYPLKTLLKPPALARDEGGLVFSTAVMLRGESLISLPLSYPRGDTAQKRLQAIRGKAIPTTASASLFQERNGQYGRLTPHAY